MSKLVTIIIPVYNAQKNIRHCLDSIIVQTCQDFKVLLIDDGSTDESLKILQEYMNEYTHLFQVITKKNEGVVKTRELGIQLADTPYIMFVDNDDFIDKDYVEVLLNSIKEKKCDIVICGYRRATLKEVIFEVKACHDEWTKYRINPPWARIFKRELLIKHNVHFLENTIGEDTYFNLMAYYYTDRIECIDYSGYNWYDNYDSVSNTKQKGLKDDCNVLHILEAIHEIYHCNTNRLLNYFYIHYAFLYLLFSGKDAKTKDFISNYKEIYNWLSKNDFLKRRIPFYSSKIKSEPLKIRLQISFLIYIYKMHLIPIFAKYYCKG